MALSESRLTTKIEGLIDECRLDEGDASTAKQKFANLLAKAIVEEIKELKLNIDGAVVYSVHFKDNMVSGVSSNPDEIKYFNDRIKDFPLENLKKRVKILNQGKEKFIKILKEFCNKTRELETCRIYNELKDINFPRLKASN